jgi:hypothetical protein
MDDDGFLYSTSFILVFGVISMLLILFVVKKWKCINGECVSIYGGDYQNIQDCKNNCKERIEKSIVEDVIVTPTNTRHDCVNNKCIQKDDGLHTNITDCNNTCGVVNYPNYRVNYPNYGLYNYGINYGYGSIWNPRRRSHMRRSHRRRSHRRR